MAGADAVPRASVRASDERRSAEEATDRALVGRVCEGDAGAFDALVLRHMERAFGIAYRLLGQREDAEDLVQEAFLLVLEKVDAYEPSRPFGPWFYRILVNRGLNARKARALRRTEAVPDGVAAPGASPALAAERSELAVHLKAALDELPEPQPVIVQLFEIEGFTGTEIGEMLDLPAGTVRWHLHRARRALRATLGNHHQE